MTVLHIDNRFRNTTNRPLHVDIRISYPDKRSDNPLSLEFVLEYLDRDPATQPTGWQEEGMYGTLSGAQAAADAFIGRAINASDWQEVEE